VEFAPLKIPFLDGMHNLKSVRHGCMVITSHLDETARRVVLATQHTASKRKKNTAVFILPPVGKIVVD
jgi:hypothetical protein